MLGLSPRRSGRIKQRAGLHMLPPEAIQEYKILYKKRFGVDLSDADASFRANNLISLYKAVLGANEPSEKFNDPD